MNENELGKTFFKFNNIQSIFLFKTCSNCTIYWLQNYNLF